MVGGKFKPRKKVKAQVSEKNKCKLSKRNTTLTRPQRIPTDAFLRTRSRRKNNHEMYREMRYHNYKPIEITHCISVLQKLKILKLLDEIIFKGENKNIIKEVAIINNEQHLKKKKL